MKFKILKKPIFHKTGTTLPVNPLEKTSTTDTFGLARSITVSPDSLQQSTLSSLLSVLPLLLQHSLHPIAHASILSLFSCTFFW